jgi:2-dehydro-3-deoxyglucarate aldolase/4-hydroxy-2-oxoheptanedioate aldolase
MNDTSNSKLRGSAPTIGTWLSIGSPVIAELAAGCGFDWLLFDMEHGCATDEALLGSLQALNGSSSSLIVRVGAPHADLLMRVLDWGADGVMVPHVDTAEEAEACARAIHYPPRGRRGFSRSVRVYGYGLRPPPDATKIRPVFIAQIETLKGVANAAEIAAVDGVDMLFVGPADLSFDIQARNSSLDYNECVRSVVAAARAAGKSTGILARNGADIGQIARDGLQHLAVESDLGILRQRYQSLLVEARRMAGCAPAHTTQNL